MLLFLVPVTVTQFRLSHQDEKLAFYIYANLGYDKFVRFIQYKFRADPVIKRRTNGNDQLGTDDKQKHRLGPD